MISACGVISTLAGFMGERGADAARQRRARPAIVAYRREFTYRRAQRQVLPRGVGTSPALRLVALALVTGPIVTALGQQANQPATPGDPMSRPTEYGIRFTPGMARAMGHLFADDVLRKRYDLPPERKDEAAEAIARRLMRMAHASQGPGRELVEFCFGQMMDFSAKMREGDPVRGGHLQFGIGFGQRVLPMLPAVRELIRDVGQDVRPMLPMKGQLKLGADLLTVKAGMDTFEAAMQRWSQGDVNMFEDPFRAEEQIKTDETSQSKQLKEAVDRAQKQLDNKEHIDRWRQYVAKAKALYEFDEPQAATADSILTESIERAERTGADQARRERAFRVRLWQEMVRYLPMRQSNPTYYFIQKQREAAAESISSIEEELKRRVDRIPTQAQRRRAEEKVRALLAEQGLDTEVTKGTEHP